MTIKFSKYHGCGNDFILIDARNSFPELSQAQIVELCHRRFGVGADGLIYLLPDASCDFKMLYYNADGKEGSMCGNGGRCVTAFADRCGIMKDHYRFVAADGVHDSYLLKDGSVRLQMKDVTCVEQVDGHVFVDTGSPHVVERVEGLDAMDVFSSGRSIRYSKSFIANGTNVNFVEVGVDGLHVRTYERGVEDETYACGTGVTAAVLAAASLGWVDATINVCPVRTLGGWLKVSFVNAGSSFTDIWLEGPAVHVFDGVIALSS